MLSLQMSYVSIAWQQRKAYAVENHFMVLAERPQTPERLEKVWNQ
jgi:hypothetical protein